MRKRLFWSPLLFFSHGSCCSCVVLVISYCHILFSVRTRSPVLYPNNKNGSPKKLNSACLVSGFTFGLKPAHLTHTSVPCLAPDSGTLFLVVFPQIQNLLSPFHPAPQSVSLFLVFAWCGLLSLSPCFCLLVSAPSLFVLYHFHAALNSLLSLLVYAVTCVHLVLLSCLVSVVVHLVFWFIDFWILVSPSSTPAVSS